MRVTERPSLRSEALTGSTVVGTGSPPPSIRVSLATLGLTGPLLWLSPLSNGRAGPPCRTWMVRRSAGSWRVSGTCRVLLVAQRQCGEVRLSQPQLEYTSVGRGDAESPGQVHVRSEVCVASTCPSATEAGTRGRGHSDKRARMAPSSQRRGRKGLWRPWSMARTK